MHRIVNDEALDTLFRTARCRHAWLPRPISDTMLRAVWELVKLGPSGGTCDPVRILFVRSDDAKARLSSAIGAEDRDALLSAPIAAIIGHRSGADTGVAAHRDAALHAAYLIVAARALGLDCGPVWRFDAALIENAFFPEGGLASSFLCALGYGDDTQPSRHEPRAGFDEACTIL